MNEKIQIIPNLFVRKASPVQKKKCQDHKSMIFRHLKTVKALRHSMEKWTTADTCGSRCTVPYAPLRNGVSKIHVKVPVWGGGGTVWTGLELLEGRVLEPPVVLPPFTFFFMLQSAKNRLPVNIYRKLQIVSLYTNKVLRKQLTIKKKNFLRARVCCQFLC